MNNQAENFGFNPNSSSFQNPMWGGNWSGNQSIRNLENRVSRLEREVQRLNNRINRLEQNMPWTRNNDKYQTDSYNMM